MEDLERAHGEVRLSRRDRPSIINNINIDIDIIVTTLTHCIQFSIRVRVPCHTKSSIHFASHSTLLLISFHHHHRVQSVSS